MKIKSLTARLCLITAAALSLAGAILRTVAMFICFDTEVGYFDASLLSTLLTVLSFAAVLLPAALCVATPKDTLPSVWPEPHRSFAPVLPFALFMASGLWMLLQVNSGQSANKILLIAGILALVAGLYYLLLIIDRLQANALSAVGYAPILWALLSVAETYADQFTTMNAPVKLSLQFGFLSVMLLTTSELRFRLSKPAPRAALCFHCIALFFCLNGSIPTLIALAAGILDRPIHGAYALALLGVGIYAALRLIFYFTIHAPEAVTSEEESAEATDTETHEAAPDPDHIIGE